MLLGIYLFKPDFFELMLLPVKNQSAMDLSGLTFRRLLDSSWSMSSELSETGRPFMTHRIHVWYIYLHLVVVMVNVGKYIIHGCNGWGEKNHKKTNMTNGKNTTVSLLGDKSSSRVVFPLEVLVLWGVHLRKRTWFTWKWTSLEKEILSILEDHCSFGRSTCMLVFCGCRCT